MSVIPIGKLSTSIRTAQVLLYIDAAITDQFSLFDFLTLLIDLAILVLLNIGWNRSPQFT